MQEIPLASQEAPAKGALGDELAVVTDIGSNTRLSAGLEPEGLNHEEQSREAKSAFMGGGFMAGAAAGAGVGIAMGGPVGAIVGTAVGAIAGVAGGAAAGAVARPKAEDLPPSSMEEPALGPYAGTSNRAR